MPALHLEPISDLDELLAAPVGRCYVGATCVLWCASKDLAGAQQWGTIDDASLRETEAILELLCQPGRTALLDWQAIERVDLDTVLALSAHAHVRPAAGARRAVVLPAGMPRILLAGALLELAPSPPQFAASREAALTALAHPLAAEASAYASNLAADTRDSAAFLARVRTALRHDLARASLQSCASSLAMSVRTLQRLLERHGTTYTTELRRARVLAAIELLELTDVKVEAIASRIGFGTSSRLSATLRREVHVTAGELRARARQHLPARAPALQDP